MNVDFRKIKDTATSLVNYLAAMGLALVFALYLSGRIGWFILAAFICAPVISVLLTLPFLSRIYAETDISASVLSKGDDCEMTVTFGNGCFLPSPPVIVEMFDSPSARTSEKRFNLSLMPFSEDSFSVKYRMRICGSCEIGAAKVRITDFFGIFSFAPKSIDLQSLTAKLAVIPDIGEISASDEQARRASELAAEADDSEDTTENTFNTFGGFPGYDSRDYVPGDPLKRINWKQSAKRGRLLVRMDDETMCSSVAVIIDSVFLRDEIFIPAFIKSDNFIGCTDDELVPFAAQYAVESALGYAKNFLERKYSVTFMFHSENGWNIYNTADESDLTQIRTDLASYSFMNERGKNRFPAEELTEQKGSVSVFCTPYFDDELNVQLSEYLSGSGGKGALKTVVCAGAASPNIGTPEGDDADVG